VTQNITERKQTEEALKRQARERAAVDAFTNSVSHDLQTPLRRIEGFSEALLEECPNDLSELARDYLLRITQQIGSMKERTDALLKLSTVVNHSITCEEVDLSALARAYLKRRCNVEPENQIETVIAPDLVARGDAHLLSIVLENLLDNAWKYTAETEKAHIECGSILKDGLTVFFVKDNGAGFDQQRADQLFDPFKKLHSETDYPGIGIGLNLVYRIITRHGGKIWAEGEPGKGASFFFTLP
jgi:signal transduction histidine kinase